MKYAGVERVTGSFGLVVVDEVGDAEAWAVVSEFRFDWLEEVNLNNELFKFDPPGKGLTPHCIIDSWA